MKLKEIRVFISEDVHNNLKVKAAREKQTMQDLAAALLTKALEEK